MELSRKNKMILLGIIILLILGILFLVWRLSDKGFGPGQEGNQNDQPVFQAPSANFQYKAAPPSKTDTEFAIENLAKSYAERFGSWSTDNLGANLKELIPLSSKSMITYLNSVKIDYKVSEFSGINTKSLAADISSLGDSKADVVVKTQRIKTKADLTEEVYYQDINISVVLSGDKWLVDETTWQE